MRLSDRITTILIHYKYTVFLNQNGRPKCTSAYCRDSKHYNEKHVCVYIFLFLNAKVVLEDVADMQPECDVLHKWDLYTYASDYCVCLPGWLGLAT